MKTIIFYFLLVILKKMPCLCSILGGIWGNTGIVTGEYEPGQWIDVTIEVTTQHLGYFFFKICPSNNFEQDPDQDCFDR